MAPPLPVARGDSQASPSSSVAQTKPMVPSWPQCAGGGETPVGTDIQTRLEVRRPASAHRPQDTALGHRAGLPFPASLPQKSSD